MLAFIEDRELRNRIVQVSTHVHYGAEIQQMISYLQGAFLKKEFLGVIIDDINVGKLNSYDEIEQWREKTARYIKNSQKVIIEISSLKSFLLENNPESYGNITALNSVIGEKKRLASFVPNKMLREKFSGLEAVHSDKEEILSRMQKIKALLPDKEILWISHFRYFIEEKGKEIEERKKLSLWVKEGAENLGDDYFDQTEVVDILGKKRALKDSSHYTEDAEKQMANIISLWVRGDRLILKIQENGYISQLDRYKLLHEEKKKIVEEIKELSKEKKHEQIIALYKKLLIEDPLNLKYMFSLIGQALLIGDNDEATTFLRKMEKIDSTNELYLFSKARLEYKQKNYKNARKIFFSLLENLQYGEQAYERIVNSFIVEKDFETLSSFLAKNLPDTVSKYKYNFLRGKYYFLSRDFKKSREYFQKSLEYNSKYEHTYIWLLKCALRIEDYDMGRKDVEISYQNINSPSNLLQVKNLEEEIEKLNR
jgi:tetratricopeptide (TPR) repeat protein